MRTKSKSVLGNLVRLDEGRVTIEIGGVKVKEFLIYTRGVRQYYHTNINNLLSKWIEGKTSPDELHPEALYWYIRANYPKMLVMTENDLEKFKKFKKAIGLRTKGD